MALLFMERSAKPHASIAFIEDEIINLLSAI